MLSEFSLATNLQVRGAPIEVETCLSLIHVVLKNKKEY
jgi:hypothetical protein